MKPKLKPVDVTQIVAPYSSRIIYIYTIPDGKHQGRLKIGATTLPAAQPSTQESIEQAAHERIKQQTQTADVPYIFHHAEIAIRNNGKSFSDGDVHNVLIRSGYERRSENAHNQNSEWFQVQLDVAKKAITAVKENRRSLTADEIATNDADEFIFRPNQRAAIDLTTQAIKKKRKHFLWNAKMRFGKTVAAMQVAKENNMQRVLIATHRPSVSTDWFEDFKKIFASTEYRYASKAIGESIGELCEGKNPFVYFASIQDLRLSKRVTQDEAAKTKAEGFDKNDEVFDTQWDMLIVDEAHEGTQSNLGDTTLTKVQSNFRLDLSGTPFNLLHKHESTDVFTWDYVMEQEAKQNWDTQNPGAPNPYADLPALKMFTYDVDTFSTNIENFGSQFVDLADGAFKFHEFFRVRKDASGADVAEFEHEQVVRRFLDLLVDDSLPTKFPYATADYRSFNKHALWLLPNRVAVIEALEKLLKAHPVFGSNEFGIVNISGNNKDDEADDDAKIRVMKAISTHEYSITLTGQRLTTGASVPQWTAVLMLSDTTSAIAYLQTAFRCQTPGEIEGRMKTSGYVFDFAPDRTLKLVAEAIELNHASGKTNTPEQVHAMEQFLNFCPIIASRKGKMEPFAVDAMLLELKKAIIERVRLNGFDDSRLYNEELLKLDELEIQKFNNLKAIVGKSTSEPTNEIPINYIGMADPQITTGEEAERRDRARQELSEEQKAALTQLKEARTQRRNAISILRAVSIRLPMLVYGADVDMRKDISLQQLVELVDDESWKEFMPAGLTKTTFMEFIKYYDATVFQGVTRSLRRRVAECDSEPPVDRVRAIAEIFNTFKNPDKETVLTPWHVVNTHLGRVFGGHDFNSGAQDKDGAPQWRSLDVDTSVWEEEDAKVLEINSKSGLYPLLVAFNMYTRRLKRLKRKAADSKTSKDLWNTVLANNVYVLCKSPMAKRITLRTLAGYSGAKTNIAYIDDLVRKMQVVNGTLVPSLNSELRQAFGIGGDEMKFTAVVGNPPYQGENHQQIYPFFYLQARQLGEYVSLIFPTGWQLPKSGNNLSVLNKQEIKEDPQIVFIDNRNKLFPGIAGAERTNIILWKRGHNNGLAGKQRIYEDGINPTEQLLRTEYSLEDKPKEIVKLAELVQQHSGFIPVQSITSPRKPYGIGTDAPKNPAKYQLPAISEHQESPDDIKMYSSSEQVFFLARQYPVPKITGSFTKFKVFVPYAWGNMSDGPGLGGAFANIVVAKPYEICTETFQEQGPFDDLATATKHAKYILTRFVRGLLFLNKNSQHSTSAWGAVPVQNYSEPWWDGSIEEIELNLMNKYQIPKDVSAFVLSNVQVKAEKNITGYIK
jgi:superfamily II DNA or RNA helicase